MQPSNSKQNLQPIHFLETILQIIEEKKINYPKSVYCFMIVIIYGQYAGYVFSTYATKPLYDYKIVFFAHYNELAPPDFMLFMAGIDFVTLLVIGVMHGILLFYVIYIIFLTIIRKFYPGIREYFALFFKIVNNFYQIFFSSFLWVLYIPFTEVHAGLMVIGGNSFLVEFRETSSYSEKPIYYLIIGALGIILTFFTGVILSYCYISYDFYENNLLKRSFRFNLILQLFARSLLVTLYYLNLDNILLIKHMIAHILGFVALYDFFKYIPFRDEFICIFYGSSTIVYELSMILFSFWELTDLLLEYNLFFLWIVPSSFLVVFITSYYKSKYFKVLQLHPKEMNENNIDYVDLFLDIIYELSLTGQSQKKQKVKLLGLMTQFFKCPIKGIKLFEKQKFQKILSENQEIDKENIVAIINELFQIFLSDKTLRKKQEIYENVLMKYCTFLSNFQNNPIKAYYELKKLLIMNENQSLGEVTSKPSTIFTIVSELISEQIEGMIAENFMYKYKIILDTIGKNKFLTKTHKSSENKESFLSFIPRTNEICYSSIADFIKLLKLKISFYEKLLIGFNSIEDIKREGCNFVVISNKMRYILEDRINRISHDKSKENIVVLKLQSLFHRLILNDRLTSSFFEAQVHEIIRKDSIIMNQTSSSSSFLELRTIILSITLLKPDGLIINKKTNKIANFFGYELSEFQRNHSIHKLMPFSLGEIHQNLVNRFIKKGPGKLFYQERAVFALNKNNYIFPVSLKLTLSFCFDNDFCVSAIITKMENSSMDLIFKNDGEIVALTENFIKEMPHLIGFDVLSLYAKFNFFFFMPDLLEKLPSEETIQGFIAKKEYIIEVFPNKVLPFYFMNEIHPALINLKQYLLKRKGQNNNNKKFFRSFLSSNACRLLFTKKLVQFSLKIEIFPIKDQSFLMLYFLQIKHIFTGQDFDDLCSYTGGLSTSTAQTLKSDNTNTNHSNLTEKNQEISPIIKGMNDEFIEKNEKTMNEMNVDDEIKFNKLLKSDSSDSDPKKNLKNSRENMSNETEKMRISKDSEKKASSLASNLISKRENLGEYLLKDIVNNKKSNKIIRRIFILSLFQIAFFLAVNILYEILVKERINSLYDNMIDIKNQMIFIDSYDKATFFSNFFLLYNKNLLNSEEFLENKENLLNLTRNTYPHLKEIQQDLIFQEENTQIVLNFLENNETQTKTTQYFSISMLPLLITTYIYELFGNFNDLSYTINFFLGNFEIINTLNSKLFTEKIKDFENYKDDLMSFYLYLSFIGIICSFCLQIISFPFIKYHSMYLEKIYLLTSRMQEKECDLEIMRLKAGLSKLESANEAYMTYDFDKLDTIKIINKPNLEFSQVKGKEKSKKSYNVKYLSSKIITNRLSYYSNYLFFLISLMIVGLYYSGIFIYMKQIEQNLNYSIDIVKYTHNYYIGLGKIDLLRMMILSHKEAHEKLVITDEDINKLNEDFKNWLDVLKDSNIDDFKENIQDSLGYLFDNYKKLMVNDLCKIEEKTQMICDDYSLEHLQFGIQGYSSYLYNKISQSKDLLDQALSNSSIDFQNINQNLLLEGDLNKTLKGFEVVDLALDKLLIETVSMVTYLLDKLNSDLVWLLLVGGIGCSLVWLGIMVARYRQMGKEMNLSKEMLRMIPLTKLSEESTIHLLKFLENKLK